VKIDAHSTQGGPRLFAFSGIVIGCLGQSAHQALDNRNVLPDRARREAELSDLFGTGVRTLLVAAGEQEDIRPFFA
jgi:hypothetical protein